MDENLTIIVTCDRKGCWKSFRGELPVKTCEGTELSQWHPMKKHVCDCWPGVQLLTRLLIAVVPLAKNVNRLGVRFSPVR